MTDVPPPSGREGQVRSPFAFLLERLCESCAEAHGAGITDREGEAVDIAMAIVLTPSGLRPAIPAYEIKLACAHLQIVLRSAGCDSPELVQRVDVVADERSFILAPLGDGYVLVLVGGPQAAAQLSARALREAVVSIAHEAGWEPPAPHAPSWRRVRVRTGRKGTPAQVDGTPTAESTQLPSPGNFEKHFTVTLNGQSYGLVRERSGHWYLRFDNAAASQPA